MIDFQVIERAKQKNNEAFEIIYNEYKNDLYFFALKATKNQQSAEDAVQDTVIEMFKSIENLQQPQYLKSWLLGICNNVCHKQFRKSQKNNFFVSVDDDDVFIDEIEDEYELYNPDKFVDSKELKKSLESLIEKLPYNQKMALIMYYYQDLSVGEISEILNCSAGTVKSNLNYGRKKLQKYVVSFEAKKGVRLHGIAMGPLLSWLWNGSVVFSNASKVYVAASTACGIATVAGAATSASIIGTSLLSTKAVAIFVSAIACVGMTASMVFFVNSKPTDVKSNDFTISNPKNLPAKNSLPVYTTQKTTSINDKFKKNTGFSQKILTIGENNFSFKEIFNYRKDEIDKYVMEQRKKQNNSTNETLDDEEIHRKLYIKFEESRDFYSPLDKEVIQRINGIDYYHHVSSNNFKNANDINQEESSYLNIHFDSYPSLPSDKLVCFKSSNEDVYFKNLLLDDKSGFMPDNRFYVKTKNKIKSTNGELVDDKTAMFDLTENINTYYYVATDKSNADWLEAGDIQTAINNDYEEYYANDIRNKVPLDEIKCKLSYVNNAIKISFSVKDENSDYSIHNYILEGCINIQRKIGNGKWEKIGCVTKKSDAIYNDSDNYNFIDKNIPKEKVNQYHYRFQFVRISDLNYYPNCRDYVKAGYVLPAYISNSDWTGEYTVK